jgi:predicted deacylase
MYNYENRLSGQFFVEQLDPHAFTGASMLSQTNINTSTWTNIKGGKTLTRNLSYTIFARLNGNDDFQRRQNVDFISDFHHWAAEEKLLGNVPRFGDFETFNEAFEISGGMFWEKIEGSSDEIYIAGQLRIAYQLKYETQ